jgi:hypothetical protein
MPSLLKHIPCTVCGRRHHFSLPVGELSPKLEYEYVCPESGQRGRLRPQTPPEIAHTAPQGAVQLAAVGDVQSVT